MRAKPYFFPWRGEVHDAHFRRRDLEFFPDQNVARLTFWRPSGAAWRSMKKKEDVLWEGLVVQVTGAEAFRCTVHEEVAYYELSTVYLDKPEGRVVFESAYGIDIVITGAGLKAELLPTVAGPKHWGEVFEP